MYEKNHGIITYYMYIMCIYIYTYIWLVVEPYPSEKWWTSSIGIFHDIPFIWWESSHSCSSHHQVTSTCFYHWVIPPLSVESQPPNRGATGGPHWLRTAPRPALGAVVARRGLRRSHARWWQPRPPRDHPGQLSFHRRQGAKSEASKNTESVYRYI